MNDEVKEILDSLNKIAKAEYYTENLLTFRECIMLLEYIENLQKEKDTSNDYARHLHNENKKLQEEIGIRTLNSRNLVKLNDELEQIIDKATEYSKNCLKNLTTIDEEEAQPFKCIHNNYLEILNGDDNE